MVGQQVRDANQLLRDYGGGLTTALVRSVSRLFLLAGEQPSESPVSLASAQQASRQYVRFYNHALPFSPQALINLWQRCAEPADQIGECEAGLAAARRLVLEGVPRSEG